MNVLRHLSVKALGAVLLALMCVGMAFAGAGPEPPANATITGPEIWGVVVIDCGAETGTVRVKRVVDCETETEAKSNVWPTCPEELADVDGFGLPVGQTFFAIPGTAFINKAKNFKIDGNIRSFDAQFKFWSQ